MNYIGVSLQNAEETYFDNTDAGLGGNPDNVQDAIEAVAAAGTGDLVGPASSTDNAIARYDGTTGKLVQDSAVTINDSGDIFMAGTVNCGTVQANTLNGLTQLNTSNIRGYSGQGSITLGNFANNEGIIISASAGGAIRLTGADYANQAGEYLQVDVNGNVSAEPVTASTVPMLNTTGATYSTTQHAQDIFHSSGLISGGGVTNNGDGTLTVAAGQGFIRNAASSVAPLYFTSWNATNITIATGLTDNALNYIYFEYTSPSLPSDILVWTGIPNHQNGSPIATVYRSGATVHITQGARHTVGDHAQLMITRLNELMYISRATGAVVAGVGTRNFTISASTFWIGLTKVSIGAKNTSTGDTFTAYYNSASYQSLTSQTAINNTQYDNAGTLTAIANNQYGVHWIYLGMDGDIYTIFGTGSYTLNQADEVQPPSTLPGHFTKHAILIAKITIQEGTDTLNIESAFTTAFTGGVSAVNQVNGEPVDNSVAKFDIDGNTIQGSGVLINDTDDISGARDMTLSRNMTLSTTQTPASASATGSSGTIQWDSDYLYLAVGNNNWKRLSLQYFGAAPSSPVSGALRHYDMSYIPGLTLSGADVTAIADYGTANKPLNTQIGGATGYPQSGGTSYNGHSTVTFSGSTGLQPTAMNDISFVNFTIFAMYQENPNAVGNDIWTAGSDGPGKWILYNDTLDRMLFLWYDGSTTQHVTLTAPSTVADGEMTLYIVRVTSSGTSGAEIWTQGLSKAVATASTTGQTLITANTFGMQIDGHNGDFGELILYNSALSNADINSVASYLSLKWWGVDQWVDL